MNRTVYNNVNGLELLVRNSSVQFCERASLGINDRCGEELLTP